MTGTTVTYRVPAVDDAAMLLAWRTLPEITRYLFTDIEPDLAKQEAWLRRIGDDPSFLHRIICLDQVPVGYCSIRTLDPLARVGTVGVYLVDKRARAGAAGLNFIHMLNHAFYVLGLNKISNQIMAANARLVRAQIHNGYREVGVMRAHCLKNGVLHDVHLFEMLRADWDRFRLRFQDWRDLDGVARAVPSSGADQA